MAQMKVVNSINLICLLILFIHQAHSLTSLPGTWDEDSFYYLISKEKENGSKYSCIRETYKDYEMTECPISNWSSPLLVNDSFKFYAIRSPGLIIQPDEGACMLLNKLTQNAIRVTDTARNRDDTMNPIVKPSTATCVDKGQIWVLKPNENIHGLQIGIGEARAFNILYYEERPIIGTVEYKLKCYLSLRENLCKDVSTDLLRNESLGKMESVLFLLPTKENFYWCFTIRQGEYQLKNYLGNYPLNLLFVITAQMKAVSSIRLICLIIPFIQESQSLTSMPGTWDEDSFYYLISKEKENGSKYSCMNESNNNYKMVECPTSNWSTPSLVLDSFKFYAIRSLGLIIQPAEGACMLFNKWTRKTMTKIFVAREDAYPNDFIVEPSTATCVNKIQIWVIKPNHNVQAIQTGIGEAIAFNISQYGEIGADKYQLECYLSVGKSQCISVSEDLMINQSLRKMESITFLLPTKEKLGIFSDIWHEADAAG